MLPLVDPVGVDDDQAPLGLAEDLGRGAPPRPPGADEVGEHAPGPDRRELVDVAHQDQPAVVRHRLEHVVGEDRVEHGRLVDDQQVAGERVLAVAVELAGLRVELEQPVEGGRLGARWPRPGAWRRGRWGRRAAPSGASSPGSSTMPRTSVVLPVPGPPVITSTLRVSPARIASRCWRARAICSCLLEPGEGALERRSRAAASAGRAGRGRAPRPRPRRRGAT